MFLNGNALNVSYLDIDKNSYGKESTYDYIKLYGNQKVNYIKINNLTLSENDFNLIQYNDVQSWDENTAFLTQFNDTLEAGNVQNLDGDIIGINVQRRDGNNSNTTDLGDIDVNTNFYEDIYALGNRNYMYQFFPYTNTMIGASINSNYVQTDFYNYCMVDIESSKVFIIDANIKSDSRDVQEDRQSFNTFNKYNYVSVGKRQFIQSGFQGLYVPSKEYSVMESIDYINELQSYVQNGKKKLIKTRRGEVFVANTYGFSYVPLDDTISQQPYLVTIKFQQIEDTPM